MRVLGIDPGIETTGFAVIDVNGSAQNLVVCGVIRTTKEQGRAERLQTVQADLSKVLETYAPIEIAGVEELFFSKNVTSGIAVAEARGVILFTLASFGCTIQEVKPVEVKSLVAGHGQASKQEMQRMIQLQCGLDEPPQPDDAADAVAIAIATAALHRAPGM